MHIVVSDRDDVTVFEKDVDMTDAEKEALEEAVGTGDPESIRERLEELDEGRADPDVREVLSALDSAGDGAKVEAE